MPLTAQMGRFMSTGDNMSLVGKMPLPRKRLAAKTLQRKKKPKLQPLKQEEEGDSDFSHFFDTSHLDVCNKDKNLGNAFLLPWV
ncbi:hypothetical protein Nmel_000416 [Mimus melanotis]